MPKERSLKPEVADGGIERQIAQREVGILEKLRNLPKSLRMATQAMALTTAMAGILESSAAQAQEHRVGNLVLHDIDRKPDQPLPSPLKRQAFEHRAHVIKNQIKQHKLEHVPGLEIVYDSAREHTANKHVHFSENAAPHKFVDKMKALFGEEHTGHAVLYTGQDLSYKYYAHTRDGKEVQDPLNMSTERLYKLNHFDATAPSKTAVVSGVGNTPDEALANGIALLGRYLGTEIQSHNKYDFLPGTPPHAHHGTHHETVYEQQAYQAKITRHEVVLDNLHFGEIKAEKDADGETHYHVSISGRGSHLKPEQLAQK